jgi:hypothetical protein
LASQQNTHQQAPYGPIFTSECPQRRGSREVNLLSRAGPYTYSPTDLRSERPKAERDDISRTAGAPGVVTILVLLLIVSSPEDRAAHQR